MLRTVGEKAVHADTVYMLDAYLPPGVFSLQIAVNPTTPSTQLSIMVDRTIAMVEGPVFLAYGATHLLNNRNTPPEAAIRLAWHLFTHENLAVDSRVLPGMLKLSAHIVLDPDWWHAHLVDDDLRTAVILRLAAT